MARPNVDTQVRRVVVLVVTYGRRLVAMNAKERKKKDEEASEVGEGDDRDGRGPRRR